MEMQTRREMTFSLLGACTLLATHARAETSDVPSAKLIPGKPPLLDYGSGVKVPNTKDAFFTLWEGSSFWLTFGFGISPMVENAKSRATKQATGVMKFMLLTLAFAPERLIKVEGNGWRKKDPAAHDFVIGELDLPSTPTNPTSDAFLGGGNVEISPFWNWGSGINPTMTSPQNGAPMPSQPGAPSNLRQAQQHAFCSLIVEKRKLSLEDVLKRAVVVHI